WFSESPPRIACDLGGRGSKTFGYRMIPVNPAAAGETIHGEMCYAHLTDIPDSIDMVDVLRRPTHVDPIVDETIACGAEMLWMQLGVVHEAAARRAQAAGLTVIMDRCTSREYRRLMPPLPA
ncbi:CoA-binding protein, partial [Candidatus Entotheonella palauensis]